MKPDRGQRKRKQKKIEKRKEKPGEVFSMPRRDDT